MNVADRDGESDSATAGKGIDEKTLEAQEWWAKMPTRERAFYTITVGLLICSLVLPAAFMKTL